MQKMAFISRHVPTPEQITLAAERGFELIHVGDVDAFAPMAWSIVDGHDAGPFQAVCCVHPWLALQLERQGFSVAVFENGNRAPEGEKPQFYAKALHVMEQPFFAVTD